MSRNGPGPGWCGSAIRAPSCAPKGLGFHSQSIGRSACLKQRISVPLSLSLPLALELVRNMSSGGLGNGTKERESPGGLASGGMSHRLLVVQTCLARWLCELSPSSEPSQRLQGEGLPPTPPQPPAMPTASAPRKRDSIWQEAVLSYMQQVQRWLRSEGGGPSAAGAGAAGNWSLQHPLPRATQAHPLAQARGTPRMP